MAIPLPRHRPASQARLPAARLRGGIVILDPYRDAYDGFYVPDIGTIDPAKRERAARDALDAAGWGAPFPQELLEPPAGEQPAWSDLGPIGTPQIRFRDVANFIGALVYASLAFHGRSFGRLLASSRRTSRSPGTLDDYRTAIARFERLCPFLPFPMLCLFRSLFLVVFLRMQGLAADWIFGVSLFPFSAHCWIAAGDRLLGEHREKIQDLVPILRIVAVSATPA